MDYTRAVLVSANVDSLVDEPGRVPKLVTSLAKEITEQKPIFAAVHLQGFKTRNRGQHVLERLVKELDDQPDIEQFQCSREYHELDQLGLCSLYFFKDEARPALYDFQRREFWAIDGHRSEEAGRTNSIEGGRLSHVLGFNPENPAAYMITRWKIFGKPFTLVNLNLTTEKSPLDGVKKHPSQSALDHQREIGTILDTISKFVDDDAVFLAGNFNCQINKEKFLQDQSLHMHAAHHEHEDEMGQLAKLECIDIRGKRVFTVNETKFDFHDMHDWVFGTCNGRLVRKYDHELDIYKNTLYEAPIYFSPTGPYGYDLKSNNDYFLRTSAPGWKERVLCNKRAWDMMHYDSFSSSGIYYGLLGSGANIGENKPVSLISTLCLKSTKNDIPISQRW